MLELRFFEFSSKLVPSFTILNAIFIIYTYLFLDGEEINILEFLKNNLFYLAPVLILVFAISYNIVVINEKGITWRSYIFPFLKKSFKWEKIKFHAKVLEVYKSTEWLHKAINEARKKEFPFLYKGRLSLNSLGISL